MQPIKSRTFMGQYHFLSSIRKEMSDHLLGAKIWGLFYLRQASHSYSAACPSQCMGRHAGPGGWSRHSASHSRSLGWTRVPRGWRNAASQCLASLLGNCIAFAFGLPAQWRRRAHTVSLSLPLQPVRRLFAPSRNSLVAFSRQPRMASS